MIAAPLLAFLSPPAIIQYAPTVTPAPYRAPTPGEPAIPRNTAALTAPTVAPRRHWRALSRHER